jgi:hypothetical protein
VRHYNEVRLHSALGYVSPLRINLPLEIGQFSPSGIGSLKQHASGDERLEKRLGKRADKPKSLRLMARGATMTDGLGGG